MNKYLIPTIKHGFTLIEVMIVIGIISILAVIALPQYNIYIARAQVTEGVQVLGGSKSQFIEFVGSNGYLPSVSEFHDLIPITNNLTNETKYLANLTKVTGISYNNGSDTVTSYVLTFESTGQTRGINSLIGGKQIGFITPESQDNLGKFWTCSTVGLDNPVPDYILPYVCRANSSSSSDDSSDSSDPTDEASSDETPQDETSDAGSGIPKKCLTNGALQASTKSSLHKECAAYGIYDNNNSLWHSLQTK